MIKEKTNMFMWTMKTDSHLPDDGINSGGNPKSLVIGKGVAWL